MQDCSAQWRLSTHAFPDAPGRVMPRTLRDFTSPRDWTQPWVGFRCALVGSRMPPAEVGSDSSTLTSTRSPTGDTVLYCGSRGALVTLQC